MSPRDEGGALHASGNPAWRFHCLENCFPNGQPTPALPSPSTGWILLVNYIVWHLPPLGKVRPQLLYRTSGQQLAHGAGAQWLLHPSRPKWHTIGRQRRHYQRMYLGILGKGEWCQSGKQEQRHQRRMEVGLGGRGVLVWGRLVQRSKCGNELPTSSRHLF